MVVRPAECPAAEFADAKSAFNAAGTELRGRLSYDQIRNARSIKADRSRLAAVAEALIDGRTVRELSSRECPQFGLVRG